MYRFTASAIALTALLAAPAIAQDTASTAAEDDIRYLEALTVTGVAGGPGDVPGSVSFISSEDLEAQADSDILRILRVVPGVNIQEEEGYGLRPNIGLRGSGSDRNSRIAVLEDGVPIAPAAYASPSAYYFPSAGRIHAIEVTKGPAVIQYGPRTTGGALHLFSTPIPNETAGYAELLVGDYGRQRIHANVGTRGKLFGNVEGGILVETYNDRADGFLEQDGAGDTGFEVDDLVVKLGLYGETAPMPWSLELKYQTRDEVSDQTYLGLTEEDFAANPFRLYEAAQNDQMVNDNELFQLTGTLELNDAISFTGIAYSNQFARNWYKSHGVNAAGNGASGDVGLTAILEDPVTYAAELSLLRGETSLDDSIVVRANNRAYYSRGVQGVMNADFQIGGLDNELTVGVRYHEDEEDRFQKEDAYRLQNSNLLLTSSGAPGSQANRVSQGEALAIFALNKLQVTDKLAITAGGRFEDYTITREDFSTSDPTRAAGPDRVRQNDDTVFVPSLAALYDVTDSVSLLAGVHKGFAVAAPGDTDADDEESINVEVGARYRKGALSLEAIGYFNDYSNLLGDCTASSGCPASAEVGDAFDGGEVDVKGLELTAEWDAASTFGWSDYTVPVTFAYTLTDTEFRTSFDSAFFGTVEAGDELNYVPDHQASFGIGISNDRWGVNALTNYVSETRGMIGQGDILPGDSIEARTIVDLAGYISLWDGVRLKAKAENLFDETYIAARRPSGIRPGKPREILFGVEVEF